MVYRMWLVISPLLLARVLTFFFSFFFPKKGSVLILYWLKKGVTGDESRNFLHFSFYMCFYFLSAPGTINVIKSYSIPTKPNIINKLSKDITPFLLLNIHLPIFLEAHINDYLVKEKNFDLSLELTKMSQISLTLMQ